MNPREKSVIPAVRKRGLPGSGEVVPSVCGREQINPQTTEKNQNPAVFVILGLVDRRYISDNFTRGRRGRERN